MHYPKEILYDMKWWVFVTFFKNYQQGQDAIMKDVFKLAFSDFVVCTFSSNVCRLVYELRMAVRPFISGLYEVITVDMDYFFMYGNDIGK